jgi:hypothetical protein
MVEVGCPNETATTEITGAYHDWGASLMHPIDLEC